MKTSFFLLLASATLAAAASFTGTLTAYDLQAGTVTLGQGNGFKTFHFRPSAEITLNGGHAKLEQIPVGSKVTITTTEPQVAGTIAGVAAAAASGSPLDGKATLNPKVEQLARACANLQDAELVLGGKPARSLPQLQADRRTLSEAALCKEIADSIARQMAIVEAAPEKDRNLAFGYFKNGVERLARGSEENIKSHEGWANKHPEQVIRGYRELEAEAKQALEKE